MNEHALFDRRYCLAFFPSFYLPSARGLGRDAQVRRFYIDGADRSGSVRPLADGLPRP